MKSLALALVLTVTASAFLATSAEAGGRRHYGYNNGCARGGYTYGYYPRRSYYQPVRYYRPAYYDAPRFYLPLPFIQIGFGGGGGYCR